jgi:DNA gyrase subunit A
VEQFKLYNRATKGKIATKFKSAKGIDDSLAGLLVVNDADEITIATKRATIVRQSVNAIPIQSRGATGVMVQRIVDDTIAAVALVPPEDTSGDSLDRADLSDSMDGAKLPDEAMSDAASDAAIDVADAAENN